MLLDTPAGNFGWQASDFALKDLEAVHTGYLTILEKSNYRPLGAGYEVCGESCAGPVHEYLLYPKNYAVEFTAAAKFAAINNLYRFCSENNVKYSNPI